MKIEDWMSWRWIESQGAILHNTYIVNRSPTLEPIYYRHLKNYFFSKTRKVSNERRLDSVKAAHSSQEKCFFKDFANFNLANLNPNINNTHTVPCC